MEVGPSPPYADTSARRECFPGKYGDLTEKIGGMSGKVKLILNESIEVSLTRSGTREVSPAPGLSHPRLRPGVVQ